MTCPGGIISQCSTNCKISDIPDLLPPETDFEASKIYTPDPEGSADHPENERMVQSRSGIIRFDEYELEEITENPEIPQNGENLDKVEVRVRKMVRVVRERTNLSV